MSCGERRRLGSSKCRELIRWCAWRCALYLLYSLCSLAFRKHSTWHEQHGYPTSKNVALEVYCGHYYSVTQLNPMRKPHLVTPSIGRSNGLHLQIETILSNQPSLKLCSKDSHFVDLHIGSTFHSVPPSHVNQLLTGHYGHVPKRRSLSEGLPRRVDPPTFTSKQEGWLHIDIWSTISRNHCVAGFDKNVATTKQSSATKFPENAASVANARALVLLSLVLDGFGLQGPVMSPQLRTNSAKCEFAWFQCILRLSQLKPRICRLLKWKKLTFGLAFEETLLRLCL